MANTVKIGMIQMRVEFHDPQKNLSHAQELVAQAAAQGADICILPECMDLGWATPNAPAMAEPVPGKISEQLSAIARRHNVWIVSGLTEQEDDKVYNCAVLIRPDGCIAAKHRKINILTDVEYMYQVGDRLTVTQTPYGKIGVSICADNLSPSLCLGHSLARMGAEIILSPCAWAVTPDRDPLKQPYGQEWHEPYHILASRYGIPVIGVSNVGAMPVGEWAGWQAIGNSIAYDSDGRCASVLPYGPDAECVQVVEVTIQPPRATGTKLAQIISEGESLCCF